MDSTTLTSDSEYEIAVLSDIHGNLPALEAVLEDMPADLTAIVCLGDIIGYNAQPKACLETVREVCTHIIRGNHDRDVVNPERYRASGWSLSGGNVAVRKGLELAREKLSEREIEWLQDLPDTTTIHSNRLLLCHSHPEERDTYVRKGDFPSVSTYMDPETEFLLVGHTHEQAAVNMSNFDRHGWVVNPGSVGQPRDGTEAKYAIVSAEDDTLAVDLRSVSYPVDEIVRRNAEYELPDSTSERLT